MNFLFGTKKSDSETESYELGSYSEPDCIYEDKDIYIRLHSNREIDWNSYENWSKNRPPDLARIEEMKDYYILNHRRMMDGMIYGWIHPQEKKIYIYDGIHRLEALKQIPHEVFFQIYYFPTNRENDIIQHFQALNKSVNVPSLYLEKNLDYYKKLVCETVVKELCSLYPYFVSPSRKPYFYNFNRDNLIEQFSQINLDFQRSSLSSHLITWLNELNLKSKEIYLNDRKTPSKCHKYNFYLFLMDWKEIVNFIEDRYQKEYFINV